jgi:hypothetical protein
LIVVDVRSATVADLEQELAGRMRLFAAADVYTGVRLIRQASSQLGRGKRLRPLDS